MPLCQNLNLGKLSASWGFIPDPVTVGSVLSVCAYTPLEASASHAIAID